MNLDDFMITCFCMIDEMVPMIIKGQRLRARGPAPKLSESEAITMEVVGSYLGLSQDKALFDYFQRHYTHFSPALKDLHRTTFVRQAANLWAIKERVWCWLRDEMISYDPHVSIVDSGPAPVCHFARSLVCPLPWRSSLWQRSCGSTDLLRFSFACPTQLARRVHASVSGSGQ
nr:hypothetical protein [Reticulibacter mediterranei]